MAPVNSFNKFSFKPESDFMHIKKATRTTGRIKLGISSVQFIDKDTDQFVIYLPSLDISSYGETLEQAEEMLKSSVDDFCTYLMTLKAEDIKSELNKLGWKNDRLHKKDFSNSSIDLNGNLMDFNAKDNKVTLSKLEAA